MKSRLSASDKKRFKSQLRFISQHEPNSIRAFVADEALYYGSYDDDPTLMFRNLMNCGCQCGTIGSLIYYWDTRAFFDLFYDEIEEIREDFEDSLGEPITIKGDLKNWLAWFAFEETAFQIANELEMDL